MKDNGASLRDRALSPSATGPVVPSPDGVTIPIAANDRCTCAEVYGENPDCTLHGIETHWALENTCADDWQNMAIEYRSMVADYERQASAKASILKEAFWRIFDNLPSDTIIGAFVPAGERHELCDALVACVSRTRSEGCAP